MKPVFFAFLTALCWSAGSFFEKRGLALSGLSPLMGITIRTATAIVVLGAFSYPLRGTLAGAGTVPLVYLILGGGVLAGSIGMLCFYSAVGAGQLSRVLPVAFGFTPLFGAVLGMVFLGEPLTFLKAAGTVLVCAGVFLVVRG